MRMRAVTLMVVSVALATSACGIAQPDQVTLLRKGTLTVCTAPDRGLFATASAVDPRGFVGFDIDVASAIAQQLKLRLKVVSTPADQVANGAALNAGRCDVAIGGLLVTDPNGDGPMQLSTPYYTPALALLIHPSSGLGTLGDLDRHRVGVLTNDAEATRLLQAGAPHARTVRFADVARLRAAFRAHRVDAVLADQAVTVGLAGTGGTTVAKYPGVQHVAVGVKNGSVALLTEVNNAIAVIVTGTVYGRIYGRYFAGQAH